MIHWLLSIIIPFKYVPRTRALQAIDPTSYFFSSIKTSPEEWHQAVACLEMRRTSVEMGPIICHVCFVSRIIQLLSYHLLTAPRPRWSNIWPYRHHQISYTTGWSFMLSAYSLLWNRSGSRHLGFRQLYCC